MTTLRTAAQQALEALEAGPDVDPIFAGETEDALRAALAEDALQKFTDVNQELEAALAEPTTEDSSEVEPVAWRWGYRSVTTGEMDWRGYVEITAHPNLRSPEIIMQPLFTAPPQRPAEPVPPPEAQTEAEKIAYCAGWWKALETVRTEPVQEPQCNSHPKAPHSFMRNASHTEDRYVCECEGWEPYEAGYQAGMEAALRAQS